MKDPVVQQVIDKYKERSELGIKKYGTTLVREDLTEKDWLIHAQEEALDLSLYLQVLINKME